MRALNVLEATSAAMTAERDATSPAPFSRRDIRLEIEMPYRLSHCDAASSEEASAPPGLNALPSSFAKPATRVTNNVTNPTATASTRRPVEVTVVTAQR